MPLRLSTQPRAVASKHAFVIFAGIVSFIVGILAGYVLSGVREFNRGYDSAKQEIAQELQTAGLLPPQEVPETLSARPMQTLRGSVTKVGSESFAVEGTLPSANPLDQPAELKWRVWVDGSTELVLIVNKDPDELLREEEAHQAKLEGFCDKMQEGTLTPEELEGLEPPETFTEQAMPLSDMLVGASVTVTADENLRDTDSFTAERVEVRTSEAAPAE